MDQSPAARTILSSQLTQAQISQAQEAIQYLSSLLHLVQIYVRKSCNQYLHFMFTVDGVSGSNTISSGAGVCSGSGAGVSVNGTMLRVDRLTSIGSGASVIAPT